MTGKSSFTTIEYNDGVVTMLDQRRLPHEEIYNHYNCAEEVADAITTMVIRGAPAIGVAAAYGIALAARHSTCTKPDGFRQQVESAAVLLSGTRPTAVNLFWAIDRMRNALARSAALPVQAAANALIEEARAIHAEDLELCHRIGAFGQTLIPDGATVLTHCNAGALATAGHGTALGVIRSAVAAGKRVRVIADETRPFLQGARLTAWELSRDGIEVSVAVDGAAAWLLKNRRADLVIVGTDRVAANGDVANKIGTYGVALSAHAAGVPFYVAAPWSTIDLQTANGNDIIIEERPSSEVTHVLGQRIVPEGVPVLNPAFDVTPHTLITALITDRGLVSAPFDEGLRAMAMMAQ
ncbi:MAG: S-methyl-5-thioribose-1-phosphate isomerase [Myxococcota bacterium]|jgi:methylthioribose-1-phosphate isomerase|nr:S-methyl-5-thioribose-1-phosphate isomerase [Myxococcota bacterium]